MVRVSVNGVAREAVDPGRTSLLTYLRETLGLTGAKYGCGVGLCGACGVLIEGRFALSCQVGLGALNASRVETIEGLGTPGRPSPVQHRLREARAGQCGFCLPGIVVRAEALWRERPDAPDRSALAAALDGNICRCGAHVEILDAVLAAFADRAGDGRVV